MDARRTKVIDKIQKLLRLSRSATREEAATAAAHAQRLMDRYSIDAAMASLDGDGEASSWEVREHVDKPLFHGENLTEWKVELADAVAHANGCRMFLWEGSDEGTRNVLYTEVCLIGRDDDVEAVRVMWTRLAEQIDRLAATYRAGRGRNAVQVRSFIRGAVDMFEASVAQTQEDERKARRSAASNEKALVRLDNALVRLDARLTEATRIHDAVTVGSTEQAFEESNRVMDWRSYADGLEAGGRLDMDRGRKKLEEER